VYHLIKDYDLRVSIMRASINPDEAGQMVLAIEGNKKQLEAGHEYLEKKGVLVQPLSKDVRWREDRCVHCTACISVCPTAALRVNRADMTVSFDSDKCIGCELCIPVCIYKAMEIQF
jgi:Fe-S-cluster-containing dehydrogenase component